MQARLTTPFAALMSLTPAIPVITHTDNLPVLGLIVAAMVLNLGIAAVALLKRSSSRRACHWRHLDKVCNALVSGDRRQRAFIMRHLIGVANCLGGLAALNYGVIRGVVDPVACAWLTWTALAAIVGITILLRTGLSRHFADPSLVTVHIICAEVFLAWGYHLGGPCRTVGMMLLFVVLFANFFASTTKVVLTTSVAAALSFGAVMARVAWEERDLPNGPQVQLVNFCVLLVVLTSLYLLVQHLIHIRATSSQRKRELVAAMARIQELATRDELTQLFNRRHMQGLLDAEQARCSRTGRPFSIAVLDIDHFKRVNDTHGHGAGDQALKSVAAILTAGMRELDVVARWGGEEFLLLFPDTDCDTASVVLRRVLRDLGGAVVWVTTPQLRVTFSAGVAQLEAGEDTDRTIERADAALYEAKRAGRNRVLCAGPTAAGDRVA